MRFVIPKLVAGGLLVAGLAAAPALSPPQGSQPPTPAPMPSHEAPGQPPAADAKPGGPNPSPRPNPLRQQIAGKENEPAETVFKNIQVMKGIPAGRLLDAMEGFSHALGANCKKCHDTENFASDDKDDKKVARSMMLMTRDINEKYIKPMPDLDKDSFVGCNTCHHGHSNPNIQAEDPGDHHHEDHHHG